MRKSKDRKRQRKQQIETDNGGWAGDGIIIQSLIWNWNLTFKKIKVEFENLSSWWMNDNNCDFFNGLFCLLV